MGVAIFIILILLLFFHLEAQRYKGKTNKEKYGNAIGYMAQSVANKASTIAQDIAEPAEKVSIRYAKEDLAEHNSMLYRLYIFSHTYDDPSNEFEKHLIVEDSFKYSLDVLGLSEDWWKKIATHIFYVGWIRYCSRVFQDFPRKLREDDRYRIITLSFDPPFEYMNEHWEKRTETLKAALSYFNISEEEWIKYGDTVIEMHNINDTFEIEKYGLIITQTLPGNIKELASISSYNGD